MKEMKYDFERFFNRSGFNKALMHFEAVTSLVSDFEDKYNIADLLNALLDEKEIVQDQVSVAISSLLIDKYTYNYKTINLENNFENIDFAFNEIKKWNAVDIVIAYNHPELGYILINPKNKDSWDSINNFKRHELLIIFSGFFKDKIDNKISELALNTAEKIFNNNKIKSPEALLKGKCRYKKYEYTDEDEEDDEYEEEISEVKTEEVKPEKTAEPVKGKMTPLYSIPVTNELFHNGNVEAWKKIIESYKVKNPGLDVYIFYEGEKINDINTLFKWGKVKHGSAILFAVAGDDIKDVSKLQKYLKQGASPQFEYFLKFPVNKVLNLF